MGSFHRGRVLFWICFFQAATLSLPGFTLETSGILHSDFESARNPENIPIRMPLEKTVQLYSNFYNVFNFTATNVDALMFRITIESNRRYLKRVGLGPYYAYEFGTTGSDSVLCAPSVDDWSMKWNVSIYVSRSCRAQISGVPAGILMIAGGLDSPSDQSRILLKAINDDGFIQTIDIQNDSQKILPIGRYHFLSFKDANRNYSLDNGEEGMWFPASKSLEASEEVMIRAGFRTVIDISGILREP